MSMYGYVGLCSVVYSYVGLCRATNPKAEWAIDAEALRARGIIVLRNNCFQNIENNKKK